MLLASGSGDHQVRICEFSPSQSLSATQVYLASMQGSMCYNDVNGTPLRYITLGRHVRITRDGGFDG